MAEISSFCQNIIARQMDMLRIAKRDYGLTEKVLAAEAGLKSGTIGTWFDGTAMPAYALVALSRVIPDHLTSLMFEPAEKHVGTNLPGDGDLDELAREAAGYGVEYLEARDPKSDAGPNLSPREKARLRERSGRIASVALAAVRAA